VPANLEDHHVDRTILDKFTKATPSPPLRLRLALIAHALAAG
jgi:hypothetical protein